MPQKLVRQDNSEVKNTNLIITDGTITVYEKEPAVVTVVGPQGPQGLTGCQGAQGSPGGAKGPQGEQGAKGDSSNIILDGGSPDTLFNVKIKLDCGGVI